MSVRIAVSLRGQMRALASQGIFATDCYAQIRAILLQKLGPEHAALLAEPQHDAEGRNVDWYAEGHSQARPLKELPEAEAQALRARAGALARDIMALSRSLTADAQARQALSGFLLRLALRHPSADDLWSLDGRPVLINWGFAPGTAGAQPQDLSRLGATPPPPAPAAVSVPPPPARTGCLPWLLPLLLLLLLLWLLLAALGILPSPLPAACFRQDDAALNAERNRAAQLDDELARLRRQLLERAALCKPETPPAAVKEPEQPLTEPEVVEPFLGETPLQPDTPKVEKPRREKPKTEQPTPRPTPKKNEDLNIPGDAAKKNDLAFLEGCWTSETGLYSHPSKEPIIAEYCFDKNGKGRRFVRERNGQVCSGSAKARFQGNRLLFNSDSARCPRGGTYVPQKVECTGSERSTQCKGNELGGSRHKWDARFRRK
ncbi:SrfA family protein [Desulfovibrio sp. SGI.169]|uniref:SrfA family protein n=1 Tax=Desulfovibrio sp. SGI.169 TaxID=3420561 RepID=UPI003D02F9EC